jgi:hypothetical protein
MAVVFKKPTSLPRWVAVSNLKLAGARCGIRKSGECPALSQRPELL